MKKVAVIGSISTDFVVNTNKIPHQGETVIGSNFTTFFGGKGANQAVALSRSGVATFMVGAVGDDNYGVELIDNLKKNKIETSMVIKKKDQPSGAAFIQIYEADNRIIIIEGANSQLSVADIKQMEHQLLGMDMLVIQNEVAIQVVEYVIAFANENAIKVLYNPAPIKAIDKKWLEKVSYLTPNETEFAELFEGRSLEDVLPLYPKKLIVTLGSQGAVYFDEELVYVNSQKVAHVVDTTGAGDTFNGYFAKGILEGLALDEAIALGNQAAGIAIQKAGAQAGIPEINEVRR